MNKFIILIIMFFADPYYSGDDSVRVLTYQGKPLIFDTVQKCEKWIDNDLENLIAFGEAYYPKAVTVKSIMCVPPIDRIS